MENSVVSNKTHDNNSLGLSDSKVMAEQASITAEGTSTSALGDEPTYDEQVREDLEASIFRNSRLARTAAGIWIDNRISAIWISMSVARS